MHIGHFVCFVMRLLIIFLFQEATLVEALPCLPLNLDSESQRPHVLLFPTDYERQEWREAIDTQLKKNRGGSLNVVHWIMCLTKGIILAFFFFFLHLKKKLNQLALKILNFTFSFEQISCRIFTGAEPITVKYHVP